MNAITTAPQHSQPTVLRPQSMRELLDFAQIAAKSTMLPRDYIGKPENVVIAVQLGSELGLAPMQALQNIAIINGRPAVFGDAMLGLVKQSPLCEDIEEHFEGDGDRRVAVCIAKRAGKRPVHQSFSVEDAKRANLWGKSGPWQQYPDRMLQMRARGFALRDAFPDVLRGLIGAEEAGDIPTIEGTAEPAKADSHAPLAAGVKPVPTDRDKINAAVPLDKPLKKQTFKEWLAEFQRNTEAAQTQDEATPVLDAALAMTEFLETRPAARAQYEAIRDACIARLWAEPPEDEGETLDIFGEDKVTAG